MPHVARGVIAPHAGAQRQRLPAGREGRRTLTPTRSELATPRGQCSRCCRSTCSIAPRRPWAPTFERPPHPLAGGGAGGRPSTSLGSVLLGPRPRPRGAGRLRVIRRVEVVLPRYKQVTEQMFAERVGPETLGATGRAWGGLTPVPPGTGSAPVAHAPPPGQSPRSSLPVLRERAGRPPGRSRVAPGPHRSAPVPLPRLPPALSGPAEPLTG